jgi:predicted dehydrogenase
MAKIQAIIIGTGGIARSHIRRMQKEKRTTKIQALVETSEDSRVSTRAFFEEIGIPCPEFYGSLQELLRHESKPDAALITTPHKFHYENVRECLLAGLHVLVEKPMVLNESEAKRLIRLRDKTGKIVVVGFNGSLSPAVQKAKQLIASGRIGEVSGVSAHVYQDWKRNQAGTWRQIPEISGGGFLFDTGSHMINTVVDIIGDDVREASAVFDNRGAPVEINSSVSGRFFNGVTFSLGGFGDATQCTSQIRIFGDKGTLETGVWGERLLFRASHRDAVFETVKYRGATGFTTWAQFIRVLQGKVENPCPPEIGLRFARLMDMIRESAASRRLVTRRRRR